MDSKWFYVTSTRLLRVTHHNSRRDVNIAKAKLTADSGDGPVAADAGGVSVQLEHEGPHVGVVVGVGGGDVDPGLGTGALTHLGLSGQQHGRVVVHVNQEDLEGSRPAGLRRAWGGGGEQRKEETAKSRDDMVR